MSKRQHQISVPIEGELRAFIEREAARQDRTLAGQVRHLIAEAARHAGPDHVASTERRCK